MSKVDIKRLDSVTKNDTTATEQINDNFQALQVAIENTVSRDGTVPNYMDADLDLNSYRIINAAAPVEGKDVVTLEYFEEKAGGAVEAAAEAKASASKAASSAQSALVASNNAIGQLAQAEGLLTATEQFVDSAKADINTAVSNAESNISTIVSDAEGSITNIAVTEANKAIANAAQEATDMATANLNSYVDGTVEPSLQTYVDQAQENANSAATSMEQAALSATSASNYANNASADADNAAESAGLAANSAAAAAESEGKAAEYLQQVSDKITVIEGSIGDIGFAPLGIDETQNKRRYLNGQVISQTQFATFATKVKAAVALYPSLSATETNWQAEVTNSKLGQCGKFVIDDTAGTIRLPKVVNINGLQDLSLLGSIKDESLPNIKAGDSSNQNSLISPVNSAVGNYGAVSIIGNADGSNRTQIGGEAGVLKRAVIDASLSSSTYQDNAPVQQEAVQYPYFIQVATGSEESVDVSTEIQLNNPFFFGMHIWSDTAISNASWLISNGSYHSGATYASFYEWLLKIKNGTLTVDGVSVKAYGASGITDYDYVINTTDTTFRLPIKVKLASGNAVVGNGMTLGMTDGTNNFGAQASNQNYWLGYTGNYGKDVGMLESGSLIGNNKTIGITTDPTKSGIETSSQGLKLYFYVGETIQDANVIAASQVLTDVANLKAHSIVETYVNGTSWYRLYSDGWCEQGGKPVGTNSSQISVNLLKPYKDTNYTILNGFANTSGTTTRNDPIVINNITTSGFAMVIQTSSQMYLFWQASGYIA